VTFTIDGQYAYPSTGEVIEAATRTVLTQLTDENGVAVQSEKMVEVDFDGPDPVRAGDQFGVGRVTTADRGRPGRLRRWPSPLRESCSGHLS
jgi:hypothetical protein